MVVVALLRSHFRAIGLRQQRGNLHLAVNRAFAAHFGRMGGQHRTNECRIKKLLDCLHRQTSFARQLQAMGQCAAPGGGSGNGMGAGAADMMLVFGNIGQMREIAESADDQGFLVGRQPIEQGFQLAPPFGIIILVKTDRRLADALDQIEHRRPFLIADGIAENAAKPANILAQRLVLVVGRRHVHGWSRSLGCNKTLGQQKPGHCVFCIQRAGWQGIPGSAVPTIA